MADVKRITQERGHNLLRMGWRDLLVLGEVLQVRARMAGLLQARGDHRSLRTKGAERMIDDGRNTHDAGGLWDDAEIISSYSRAQAIKDGVLVDVTPWAKEAGFRFPVAVTSAVWHEYIVPDKHPNAAGQSEKGSMMDVFTMLHWAIRASKGPSDLLYFKVVFTLAGQQRTITLKSHCGPGDNAEPVITIMKPDED